MERKRNGNVGMLRQTFNSGISSFNLPSLATAMRYNVIHDGVKEFTGEAIYIPSWKASGYRLNFQLRAA